MLTPEPDLFCFSGDLRACCNCPPLPRIFLGLNRRGALFSHVCFRVKNFLFVTPTSSPVFLLSYGLFGHLFPRSTSCFLFRLTAVLFVLSTPGGTARVLIRAPNSRFFGYLPSVGFTDPSLVRLGFLVVWGIFFWVSNVAPHVF